MLVLLTRAATCLPTTCQGHWPDYVGTGEWVQFDLQSIQHRDYFGHLSYFITKA